MKKCLLAFGMALAAVSAVYAQKTTNGYIRYDAHALLSVPHSFAYSDTPMLIAVDADDMRKLNIYDENIDLVKSIHLNDFDYHYQLTYRVEEREVKSVTEDEPIVQATYASYESFVEYEKTVMPTFTEDCLKIEQLDNGDRKIMYDYSKMDLSFVGPIENQYFHYEVFGEKYPSRYLIEHDGKVKLCAAIYRMTLGDWMDKGEQIEDFTTVLSPIRLSYINLNNNFQCQDGEFLVSQTLFNGDEKFEYIVPKVKLVAGTQDQTNLDTSIGSNKEEIQRKTLVSKESQVAMVGVQVVSEDGSVVKDIDFESFDGTIYMYGADVIIIGKNTYLAFGVNGKTIFFKIDRTTSSIKKVEKVCGALRVSPSIVNKGNVINVDFGKDSKNDSEISVFSASGAKVKSVKVPAGQKGAQFILNAPAGMYIVNKTSQKEASEARKIVVK